ncbi:MAG: hypothetical protein A2X28_08825 [Elusimicrobia bacterium GWA2_56_46]|nr:MAG: hypothetical protein A2X28_08825 [Elusimicrobia bacterium GWA2_56_46]OGR54410.1 MAG: hypothetical protein A2X39_03905 [Elusimicrobia bacterium GWC2_56_31]HBB67429.1 hypothetical protein [Elusimicrobiota bacterium]HBW22614.1 hypothetical protein [Elusimicrobiota bacterium]
MSMLKKLRKAGLPLVLAALFSNTAVAAADIYFAAPSNGLAFHETVLSLKAQSEMPNKGESQPVSVAVYDDVGLSRAAAFGIKVYNYKVLYSQLGYPDPGYFGASPEEIRDLETYTDQGVADSYYRDINSYLRFYPESYEWKTIGPEKAEAMVKNLDRLFARVPQLPGDLILFRGLTLKFRANKSYGINEEFVEKGYTSTTTSYPVAEHFATHSVPFFRPITDTTTLKAIFAIYNNRPGERGVLMDNMEDEIILRHGIKFKVMAKKEIGEKFDFYLVQACSDPCESSVRRDIGYFWDNFRTK